MQHPEQCGDGQQVSGRIQRQGRGRSREGQQPAPQRWTHQLAHVEHHREAGDVGAQFLRILHQQGAVFVAGREFVAAGHPHQQGAEQQHQHLRLAVQQWDRQGSEQGSTEQPPLGPDQHGLAPEEVGGHPSRPAEQQAR